MREEKGALTAVSRLQGVVATLESPDLPHCLDWVSIPNTSERPAISGAPSHPQAARQCVGWGPHGWQPAPPTPPRHSDPGTFHTLVTLPARQWLSQRCKDGGDMRGHLPIHLNLCFWTFSLRSGGLLRAQGMAHTSSHSNP